MLVGAVEGGGTKFNYAVFDQHGTCIDRIWVNTTIPEDTLQQGVNFFRKYPIEAIGIGMFGPLYLSLQHKQYGSVVTTPKKHWSHFNVLQYFKNAFNVPIAFELDVNVAAVGEAKYGAGIGKNNILYFTVGTGIGAGVIVNGTILHGASHPEMGHMIVSRHEQDTFSGVCSFHGQCLEGMASGPAIEARWKIKGDQLEEEHEAWDIEAFYMAQAIVNGIFILAPNIIILGGGVMQQEHLLHKIRKQVQESIGQYSPFNEFVKEQDYIVQPGLGNYAGIVGAFHLALDAYEQQTGVKIPPIQSITISNA